MSWRRLFSKARSWGEESGGRRAGGTELAADMEGNRNRIRPAELEGGTAIVSGLVMTDEA